MFRPDSAFSGERRCQSAQSNMTSEISHEDARHLLQSSQQRWSQTHDQLRSAIFERTTSPLSPFDQQRKDRDIVVLRQSLAQMEAEMAHYKEQLKRAETTILQQQATIRNQSKAIENPRPVRDFPQTPHHMRQGQGQGAFGMIQSQNVAPPPFNLSRQDSEHTQSRHAASSFSASEANRGAPSAFERGMGSSSNDSAGHTPNARAGSSVQGRNEFAPIGSDRIALQSMNIARPEPATRPSEFQYNWQTAHDPFAPSHPVFQAGNLGAGNQPLVDRQCFTTPDSVVTNPYSESAFRPSSNPMLCPPTSDTDSIKGLFQKVFDMAQQYARTHANFPSTAGDNALPQKTKEKLLNAATTTTAFGLMSDWQTRYLLVGKVILQWIMKHILRFSAFNGLDKNIDHLITGTKAAIYQSTPPQIRFLLLTNVANEIKKLRGRSDFSAYVQYLSNQHAQTLLQMIRPMMHQSPIGEKEDLTMLLQESYRLAEMMFAGTDEFSLDFHPVGCQYEASEMTLIELQTPNYGGVQLHPAQMGLRLGATPIVRMRRNAPDGMSQEQILVKAKVLLKR